MSTPRWDLDTVCLELLPKSSKSGAKPSRITAMGVLHSARATDNLEGVGPGGWLSNTTDRPVTLPHRRTALHIAHMKVGAWKLIRAVQMRKAHNSAKTCVQHSMVPDTY